MRARTAKLLRSNLAADCGISQPTAKAWFSILEATFIAFQLPAFHANWRKRLVKTPKLYLFDTGLACWLLGIREPGQLRVHPLGGPLFETWVVSEVLKHRTHRGRGGGLSFYRDSHGSELDLVIDEPDFLTLVEAKSGAAPKARLLDGARRARPSFANHRSRCDLVLVYGGHEFQQRSESRFMPWRLVRSASPPKLIPTVHLVVERTPVAGAEVIAVFPGRTWTSARSDEQGSAELDMHPGHLPLSVFVARDGFAAHIEAEWVPDERVLHVEMTATPGGGSLIARRAMPESPVEVVVKDERTSIELIEGQSSVLEVNELGSAVARELVLSVVRVAGDVALLEYSSCNSADSNGSRDGRPAGPRARMRAERLRAASRRVWRESKRVNEELDVIEGDVDA